MQFQSIKHENVWYIIAIILAFALRFTQLGALPLSDTEADWALQAFDLAKGLRPLLGPQPIYILPTSILFFIFGTSNFLARFVPALTGSLLILVPYLFRQRIRPVPSLLLAFFLALDPGLVSLSRQVGSLIPALTFVLLAWAFWWQKRSRAAGVFAGLALLSGPSIWAGLLGLGLAWVWHNAIEKSSAKKGEADQGVESIHFEDLKVALMFGGATILLGGTMFLLSPNGLSAWLNALPVYLAGWVKPSGVPGRRLLLTLVAYQPMAVIFGLLAIARGWWQRRKRYKRLSLWLLTALLLALLYPARQIGDLAWMLIPLWLLTALELSNHLSTLPEERREVFGVSLLILILLSFSWLNYAGIALDPQSPIIATSNAIQIGGTVLFENIPPTRYILLIGVFLLLLVSVLMVALGWSARIARLGLVYGLTVSLGIYALGMAISATGLRTLDGWELWWSDKQPLQAELLVETLKDQSEWSTGDVLSQDVTILSLESPAMEWLLRDRNLQTISALNMQEAPAIVISTNMDGLDLPIAYRGQDFTWRREPFWDLVGTYEWIKWSVFHEMPYDSEMIIVWVRNDLFVDTSESLP